MQRTPDIKFEETTSGPFPRNNPAGWLAKASSYVIQDVRLAQESQGRNRRATQNGLHDEAQLRACNPSEDELLFRRLQRAKQAGNLCECHQMIFKPDGAEVEIVV